MSFSHYKVHIFRHISYGTGLAANPHSPKTKKLWCCLYIISSLNDVSFTFAYVYIHVYRGWSRKKLAESLRHHNFATIHQRLVQFSAIRKNLLHDKGQCLNTAIKYLCFAAGKW